MSPGKVLRDFFLLQLPVFLAAGSVLLYAYKRSDLDEKARFMLLVIGLVLLALAPYVGVFAVRMLYKRRIGRAQQV